MTSTLATPYPPSGQAQAHSVFLAGPFKALVDPETGEMRGFERTRYEALIEHLEYRGYTVHNAHRREAWGADFLAPDECTRIDYDQIRDCDLFVAFPGDPASPGTHIEIGWAAALGKPIMLLLDEEHSYAFLVRGLHAVAEVTYVSMPSTQPGVDVFAAALARVEKRLGQTPPASAAEPRDARAEAP